VLRYEWLLVSFHFSSHFTICLVIHIIITSGMYLSSNYLLVFRFRESNKKNSHKTLLNLAFSNC
jgi:hypothetical protein